MRTCLLLLWLVASITRSSAETPDDPVFRRLASVDVFAFGGVGFAAETSQGERDYKLLLARASALTDFERLFTVGNIQAKCYALVAIRELNRRRFAELSPVLRDSQAVVMTMSGCIGGREPLSTVIARIESGDYPRRTLGSHKG